MDTFISLKSRDDRHIQSDCITHTYKNHTALVHASVSHTHVSNPTRHWMSGAVTAVSRTHGQLRLPFETRLLSASLL